MNGLVGMWRNASLPGLWMKALSPSPYGSNPLNINPLRRALGNSVDFERLRATDTANLYVSATNVWTGKLTVFEREILTADHLLASACLPTVFQAVEIDGVPYWDGGYLGNPVLYPLHQGSQSRDILLVQINPVERRETPRTPEEIQDRLNEITFNANLVRELRAFDFLEGLIEDRVVDAEGVKRVLLHRIDGADALEDCAASTRLDARWRVFEGLRDKGRKAAKAWLEERFDAVGHESTLNFGSYQ